MNSSYIVIFIALLVIFIMNDRKKRRIVSAIKHIQNKKKLDKEIENMKELASQFVGKECIIYTITSTLVKGTIKEVTNEGLLVQRPDSLEAISFEYIISIREWPRNSKGKKKTIFE